MKKKEQSVKKLLKIKIVQISFKSLHEARGIQFCRQNIPRTSSSDGEVRSIEV